MDFQPRRAAAAAAFGACHVGRACVCEPALTGVLAPSLTIGVRVPAPAPEPPYRFKNDE
jgi:hypothetical protein